MNPSASLCQRRKHDELVPTWMVSNGKASFGPFASKEEARAFVNVIGAGRVYDDRVNRASPCGPWRH